MNTATPLPQPTPARRPSPMRVIRRWLFGERALRGPAAIELDVVDCQVTREETAVRFAAEEAAAISAKLTAARAELAADLKNDGKLDESEARHLARTLMDSSITANRHTKTLEALT